MRKFFSSLLALALICSFAGFALASDAEAPAPVVEVELQDMLTQESCDAAPAHNEGQDAVAGLEDQLRFNAMAEDCNGTVCTPNQFCCNFSCSICAPKGGGCIQIVCD